MTALPLADSAFRHEIENTAASLRVPGIPVLDRRILHIGPFLNHYLHHGCMQLVLIPHRSRTTLQITHIRILVRHYQGAFKLSGAACIDPEIAGQFHRTADTLGDIAERTVTEDCGIQGSIEIVSRRNH